MKRTLSVVILILIFLLNALLPTGVSHGQEEESTVIGEIIEIAISENIIQVGNRNYIVEKVFLEVRISNLPAIRLYQKQGYKIAGRRKYFYQDTGEDAYTMVLDLKNQPNQKECKQ